MITAVGASAIEIYEAVVSLTRSIAGRSDIDSLLSGLDESLRRIVHFDHLGLILPDPSTNTMQGYILNEPGNPPIASLRLPVDDDPAGWVWLNQQTLILSCLESETRWPRFVNRARAEFGISTTVLVPLTAGNNKLGAFGFSSVAPMVLSPAEIAFLERVAGEFAVAVDSYLARQEAIRERDRLRTLFDITNSLVSKLGLEDLLAEISRQVSRVIRHDYAVVMLRNNRNHLEPFALHSTGPKLFEELKSPLDPAGLPAAQVFATGKPVVATSDDMDLFPATRRFVALGFRSICTVPLRARDRIFGTLDLLRMTDEPWTPDDIEFLAQVANQVAIAVENSLTYRELEEMKERLANEKLYLEDEIRLDFNNGNMIGGCAAFQSILKSIQIVASTDATVLIEGETGTGKELVARAIHELSSRGKAGFVKVNCAAIPASLLESELFGHEKGSFTGAVAQKIGRFELAHHGTLFLDEIGELPLELQPKLLRAIQDQEFERVGGNRTIKTDVRFVAATHRDLKSMVHENRFRADLYYRLHVFPLSVPPLRERREDIPMLTRYFVQKHAQRMGRKIERISPRTLDALTSYDWPGNIRELQNVIERSVILSNGPELQIALPQSTESAAPFPLRGSNSKDSEIAERARILQALRDANGIVGGPEGAAARLGLKRTTLQSRMQRYNITRYHQ